LDWKLGLTGWLAYCGAIAFSGNCAFAQLKPIPDNSLGAQSSVVIPNVDINGIKSDRIDGGAIRSANLFHSFQEFNIDEGRGAYFTNPAGIENILSRVTGGNASNILGKLGVLGNANLFLINPSGIIFGKNASLDVKGSFVGTTASAIGFGNQGFFSATNPNNPELLTVNPSAFFFNQIAATPTIQNNSVAPAGLSPSGFDAFGLRVPDGRSLLLVGGNISMDGGSLNAFGGRVELGGLAEAATVGLNLDGKKLSLSFPDAVARADVSLGNNSSVDVRAGGEGSIAINVHSLDLSGGSFFFAGIGQGLGTASSQAGDITLNATEAIRVRQSSGIGNVVLPNATGNSGDLIIITGSLFVTDISQLVVSTFGQGSAGNVIINARDRVSFDGRSSDDWFRSAALSSVEETGIGKGGEIRISTGELSLTNGAELNATTRGQGSAGNVVIDARDRVSFDGSYAFSSIQPTGIGKGGDIRISTGELSLTNGAALVASTRGQGSAGDVIIDARDHVSFDGGSAFSSVRETGRGKGGDIRISTGELSLINSAQLLVLTSGQGSAGSVIINARNRVSLDGTSRDGKFGSAVISSVQETGIGNSGEIRISTGELLLTNGAQLDASTLAQGDAGNVNINARNQISFDGVNSSGFHSGVLSGVGSTAVGKGSSINITTSSLSLTNGAILAASSFGEGRAGDVEVKAGFIRLDQGGIISETTSSDGGNITLSVEDILLLRQSGLISTNAGRAKFGGDGGNITINAPNGFIVAVPRENSDITANAYTGKGGRVQIRAFRIYGTQLREKENPQTSDITASSQFGINGTVEINTPEIDPNRGLVNLPSVPLDTEVSQVCQPRTAENQSSFIITGRGGLPPNPRTELLSGDAVQVDWVTLNPRTENRASTNVLNQATTPTPAPIVEAQGWVRNAKGEVVLTAYAPIATPHNSWQKPAFCHGD
jgi:filamentous hemagglutinin family protein